MFCLDAADDRTHLKQASSGVLGTLPTPTYPVIKFQHWLPHFCVSQQAWKKLASPGPLICPMCEVAVIPRGPLFFLCSWRVLGNFCPFKWKIFKSFCINMQKDFTAGKQHCEKPGLLKRKKCRHALFRSFSVIFKRCSIYKRSFTCGCGRKYLSVIGSCFPSCLIKKSVIWSIRV